MSLSAPSEAEVRAKAYELWESNGRRHGGDKEDWFNAADLLGHADADEPSDTPTLVETVHTSAADIVKDGLHTVAAMATGAAQLITELFSSHETPAKPQ